MALPNDKITTTMVGQELGISTRNVGNLCRSEAINKWSKWKPVRFNTGGNPLTEAQLESSNFGIAVKKISTLNFLPELIQTTDYLKPRGTAFNEGYRLGDFRGYKHITEASFEVKYPTTIYSGGSVAQNYVALSESGDFSAIYPKDVYHDVGAEDLYIGLAITNDSNSVISIVTSPKPIDIGGNILIPFGLHSIPSSSARASIYLIMTNKNIGSESRYVVSLNNVLNLYPDIKFWSYLDDGTVRQRHNIGMSSSSAPQPPRPILWEVYGDGGWISVDTSYNVININVRIRNISGSPQVFNPSMLRYSLNLRGTILTNYNQTVLLATPTNISISSDAAIPIDGTLTATMSLPIPDSINTPYKGEVFLNYRDVGGSEEYQSMGANRVQYQ